jgi:hypothetical protein
MGRISLYIKDEKNFREFQNTIKDLWYKKFSESLSFSDVQLKSLEHLKESLEKDEIKNDSKRQNIHQYCRTGFSY